MADKLDNLLEKAFKEEKVTMSAELNEKIIEHATFSQRGKKSMSNKKRWAAVAVVACLLVPTTVFAHSYVVSGYVSSKNPFDYKKYKGIEDIDKARDNLGIDFMAVESFENGYTATRMDISGVDKTDENFKVIGNYRECWIDYKNDNNDGVSVIVNATQNDIPSSDVDEPSATKDITLGNGQVVTLQYFLDHYKFVPVDYEMTDEDIENENKPHYYISVGADQVEEQDMSFCSFEYEGISYSLMDMYAVLSEEEMYQMAEEILNSRY